MSEITVTRIAKLEPGPGDVIFFEMSAVLSDVAHARLSAQLSKACNGAKCVVLEDGLRLVGILGKEKAEEYKRTGKLL